MSKISEEDKAFMTQAEIEAIENDEDEIKDTNDADDEAAIRAAEQEREQAEAARAAAAGDAAAAAAAAEQAKQQEQQQNEYDSAPLFTAEMPEGVEDKVADFEKRKKELGDKLDDGDITTSVFMAELDKINSEHAELNEKVRLAKLSEEMHRQQINNNWNKACQVYLNANPDIKGDPHRLAAFDNIVKAVAGEEQFRTAKDEPLLEEALKRYRASFGGTSGKPAQKSAGRDIKAPPSLGGLPQADIPNDDNRWSSLDDLKENDPLAFEDALDKLSDADRDAYSRRP